jgi:hypothetical protein
VPTTSGVVSHAIRYHRNRAQIQPGSFGCPTQALSGLSGIAILQSPQPSSNQNFSHKPHHFGNFTKAPTANPHIWKMLAKKGEGVG